MELARFISNFEESIDGVAPNSLTPETEFKTDIKEWDSLSVLTILAMVDSEYSTEITAEELKKCVTINDLFHLIKIKKN